MCKEAKKHKRCFNDRIRDAKRRSNYVKKSEVNALLVKTIKKYLQKKKKAKKTTNELHNFEKLSISSNEDENASLKRISSGELFFGQITIYYFTTRCQDPKISPLCYVYMPYDKHFLLILIKQIHR